MVIVSTPGVSMENVAGESKGLRKCARDVSGRAGAYQGPAPKRPSVMLDSELKSSLNVVV
jgi:hypothetical protein